MNPADIINFWFSEEIKKAWFNSTAELDNKIRQDFESVWQRANNSELDNWMQSAEGCLALCIILDQFPLNMFRGEVKSFASAAKAIAVSKHAIEQHFDQQIEKDKLAFLLMPLMHSENLADQELSVQHFTQAGLDNNIRFAQHHRDLIFRFGRFPHRNKILERQSTQEELDYLNSKEAFKG